MPQSAGEGVQKLFGPNALCMNLNGASLRSHSNGSSVSRFESFPDQFLALQKKEEKLENVSFMYTCEGRNQ